ncbi:MAG: hypothetical protein LHW56_03545 [Candidatus Cloacimonetes bacterium]|jgi:RNA polymerase sigma-70 factor (ECF subfamily)|nr:hypothetical protein [Candidatus Cloacimonadota bacterium]MDY0171965.1 sigma-70 family RNA polymerase sigma factor [Candidatus Cloacimonadaceae bacterium]
MKESSEHSFTQLHYEQLIGLCDVQNAQNFRKLNMAPEIANAVLLMLLKDSPSADYSASIQEQAKAFYPKDVEEVFASYQKKIFGFCYSKTQDPELSQDIAQETILQLLSSQAEIKNIPAWLSQVSHNLLCKHYQAKAGDKALYTELCKEGEILESALDVAEPILLDGLDPKSQSLLLQSPEYKEYEAMHAFKNMAEYADSLQVSPKVAQKRKDKIVRNLKAKILLAMGWENTPDILDYHQYDAILRFIREMLKIGTEKLDDRDAKSSRYRDPKLIELMRELPSIQDWGISALGKHRFSICLFHLNQENKPVGVSFVIHLDERNHLSIEDYKRNKVYGSFVLPANTRIPTEMGMVLWSFEEVMARIKQ